MKVDKEVFIKHHFWILMILVLLLPLVCLLVLWTSASAKVEDAEKSVKAVEDKLTKISSPKNDKFVKVMNEKDEKVDAQKTKIWKAAWEAQAGMINWPDNFEGSDKLNDMYFGDPIPIDWRFSFHKVNPYRAQYDANIEIVLPVKGPTDGQVQYHGGPEAVVPPSFDGKWKASPPPDADDMWFMQEDLAIQRELLQIIRDTNDAIATFRKVPGAPKPDKSKGEIDHQIFTNSDFKVDLVLAEEKGKKTFRCVLTNISGRRQPLSYIPFIVSIKGMQDPQYFWADGEPLAPNASFTVKHKEKDKEEDWVLQTQSGTLQAGAEVLQGVMQVYDWRTAPIKRLDKVLMGVSSSRTVAALIPPLFEKKDEPAPALGGDQGAAQGGNDAAGGMAAMGKMMGDRANRMGAMGGGMGGGASSADKTKNGLDKKRYISVSKQVRRMPVAFALVIDQAHIQDFLTVAANSKLRIQTTEVYWQRFRDDIKPTFKEEGKPGEETPGGKTPGTTPTTTPRGVLGGKGGMGAMADRPGPSAGGNNIGMMMMAMRGRMAMTNQMGRMGPSMNKMGMGEIGRPGRGGVGTTMPMGPMISPQAAPDSMEPEEESSLVHLAYYGIASIYEKYPPKKEGTEMANNPNP